MTAARTLSTWSACFACVLLLAFAMPAASQQQLSSERDLVTPLSTRLGVLAERAAFLQSPDRKLFEDTQDSVLELQRTLDKSTQPLPSDYRAALEGFTVALPAPEDVASLTPEARGRLMALREDLALKNRYLTSGMGVTAFSKSLLVTVEVRTRRQGRLVDGFEVFSRPVAYPSEWRPTPFGSLTNKARRQLPPGIYTFIFRRGTEEMQRPVEIGEEGLPTQIVWHEIP